MSVPFSLVQGLNVIFLLKWNQHFSQNITASSVLSSVFESNNSLCGIS